jgi:hypothetical protein
MQIMMRPAKVLRSIACCVTRLYGWNVGEQGCCFLNINMQFKAMDERHSKKNNIMLHLLL